MRRRPIFVTIAAVLFMAALGVGAWAAFLRPDPDQCYACNRPVHAHSRTTAMEGGRTRAFCCPACALSLRAQTGKPVTITKLTSFLTGKPLAPDNAVVVVGSDINMCSSAEEIAGADKQPAGLLYDRCAPSIIAFAEREEAVRFRRQHGGEVKPFAEVTSGFRR